MARVHAKVNELVLQRKGQPLRKYMEPFAGMVGVMCEFKKAGREDFFKGQYFACDINPDLVALLRHAQASGAQGMPDDLDKAQYDAYEQEVRQVRDGKVSYEDYVAREGDAMRAFYGVAATRDGEWYNQWNSDENDHKPDGTVNYNSRHNKIKYCHAGLNYLQDHLSGVTIEHTDVFTHGTPTDTLVYADPPYHTNNYTKNPDFSRWNQDKELREQFWALMEEWSKPGR